MRINRIASAAGGGGGGAANTMGVRSRSKRRRAASAGGTDLIGGLGDAVLVRILELLPDAGDAALARPLDACQLPHLRLQQQAGVQSPARHDGRRPRAPGDLVRDHLCYRRTGNSNTGAAVRRRCAGVGSVSDAEAAEHGEIFRP